MKLFHEDLNPDSYSPHFINTYTYGMIIAPRVCGGVDVIVIIYIYFLIEDRNFILA